MNPYQHYLRDLVSILKQKLTEAKQNQTAGDEFQKGVTMGLYDSLDTIKTQAIAFQIPLHDLGLNDFEPANFL